MKKLTASIFTVLLATVGAANAEIASKAYVDQRDGAIDAKITTLNGAASVEGSVANKIAAAIDQAYDSTSTNAQSGTAVAQAIAGVASTAGSALQSVTANDGAGVVTNIATNGTSVTMTKAKVSGSDIADNAGIAATQLATDVQISLGKANTALQADAIADMLTKTEAGTTYATQSALTTETSAREAADTAINDKIGTVPANSTVMAEIAAAQTASVANLDLATVGGEGNVVLTVGQENGQVSATAGKISDANIADNAAIAQSKIAGLGTAASANVSTAGVAANEGGLVTGGQVQTAIASANTAALEGLALTDAQATGSGVVTQVTQTNGQVAVTKADPLSVTNYTKLEVNQGSGKYALTAIADSNNNITGYAWELIERVQQ